MVSSHAPPGCWSLISGRPWQGRNSLSTQGVFFKSRQLWCLFHKKNWVYALVRWFSHLNPHLVWGFPSQPCLGTRGSGQLLCFYPDRIEDYVLATYPPLMAVSTIGIMVPPLMAVLTCLKYTDAYIILYIYESWWIISWWWWWTGGTPFFSIPGKPAEASDAPADASSEVFAQHPLEVGQQPPAAIWVDSGSLWRWWKRGGPKEKRNVRNYEDIQWYTMIYKMHQHIIFSRFSRVTAVTSVTSVLTAGPIPFVAMDWFITCAGSHVFFNSKHRGFSTFFL